MNTIAFAESASLGKLDPENRIMPITLIKAGVSGNKKEYAAAVLRDAVGIFDNSLVFLDHNIDARQQRTKRSAGDVAGVVRRVVFDESSQTLRGEIKFAATDAGRNALALAKDAAAGDLPSDVFGLSINAFGQAKQVGDRRVVTAITKVESVDCVLGPAAGGRFEKLIASLATEDAIKFIMADASFEQFIEARPDYVERLQKASAPADTLPIIEKLIEQRDAAVHTLAVKEHVRGKRAQPAMVALWESALMGEPDQTKWAEIDVAHESLNAALPSFPIEPIQEQRHNPAPELRSGGKLSKKSQLPRPGENVDQFTARMGRAGR